MQSRLGSCPAGLAGGNCDNGGNCGSRYLNVNNAAADSNWNIGPSHSSKITFQYEGLHILTHW